jgi:hypothetical protein
MLKDKATEQIVNFTSVTKNTSSALQAQYNNENQIFWVEVRGCLATLEILMEVPSTQIKDSKSKHFTIIKKSKHSEVGKIKEIKMLVLRNRIAFLI